MDQFREVQSIKDRPKRELEILRKWKEISLFEQTRTQNEGGPEFIFFEGPPTANGKPGIHHVLSRVFKDIYIRYQGLKGCQIPRRAGWDCHGLPVEREVEKALGIESKIEIETKYGIGEFNRLCRESVLKYVNEWNDFTERMAFQVDLNDPYFTMDNEFIESVWSLLKTIWERGLIYQGHKVVPYDPVLGTTMSDAEVDQGYRETEDPSLTVRFRVKDEKLFGKNTYFLVWTTTPWTLPSNVALALNAEETYVVVERSQDKSDEVERLICAEALYGTIFSSDPAIKKQKKKSKDPSTDESPPKIVKKVAGSELANIEYEQLLTYLTPDEIDSARGKRGWYTVPADFVTMDTGTGIVHIAPAYGADDLAVGQKHDLPILYAVGLDGNFVNGTPHAGIFFKDADKAIIKELKERGMVWKSERYKHSYPFGYRTGVPLLYYAKNAWYIRTTEIKQDLIQNNETIRWVPEHVKHGRFGNWLTNNRDWALSRERYWGTPLPIWTDEEGKVFRIIGSVRELEELSGKSIGEMDLHRPHIDEIEFTDPETGAVLRRVPEVIDCWFDSGAMPYAQWGYPVRGKQEFQRFFPADFICEAIDQTRGWFYTLLAISTMVSNRSSYKNVVCLGHVLDEKGEKMSKSKGNVVDPYDVFHAHGADAIRWYFLTASPPGHSRRVGQPGKSVSGKAQANLDPIASVHGLFNMLINSIGFFAMYANIDNIRIGKDWEHNPVEGAPDFAKRPEIDRWVLSALQDLIRDCTIALDDYDCQRAGQKIEAFTDALSNWYIRRNRRRFWKGELDPDKLAAYDTLYRALTTIARLVAPFMPFVAEDMYELLVVDQVDSAAASIHLSGWPTADHKHMYDETALREGEAIKQAAYLGRAARMASGLKVRQPLARVMVHVDRSEDRAAIERNTSVLRDELNVKAIEFLDESAGIIDYNVKPNLPRIGKELGSRVRDVQQFCNVESANDLARRIRSGSTVAITCADGSTVELAGEDFIVESVSKDGTSGMESEGMLVALDTDLTPDLVREGMARDLIRNVQELRKNSGLEVTDRITLFVRSEAAEVHTAVSANRSLIEEETLSTLDSDSDLPPQLNGARDMKIGGADVRIAVLKGPAQTH